jgi:uncharacterized protein YbcI
MEAYDVSQVERGRSELSELSNAMVKLYKDHFGRGPTKVKTSYADVDTIVSTLENSLTAAEAKMAELDEQVRVEETRLFFQRATRDDFIGTVEEITGRKVRAFVSGMDSDNDVASEVFYLEPQ